MNNKVAWILAGLLPLFFAVGSEVARGQASDFLTESIDRNLLQTSNIVFEDEETFRGTNVKLDPIEIPIFEIDPRTGLPFIDPGTGLSVVSDRIFISAITGILTSAPPPIGESGQDVPENVTLFSRSFTFSSGETDTLTVGGVSVGGESNSITIPAMSFQIGDDIVELNSFTISFTSDAEIVLPPGVQDLAEAPVTRTLSVGLVSDGAIPIPEPGSLAIFGTALVALGIFGWRRRLGNSQ